MVLFTFFKIISFITAITGAFELLAVFIAIGCGEYSMILPFVIPMVGSFIAGLAFFIFGRKKKFQLSTRSVFVIVGCAWLAIGLFGSLPLYLSGTFPSFTDCVFESMSGFSTTGATILSSVEELPRSINFWRCEMHWLGGIGIIALTIALMPLLGVGGFQLIKAESTGVNKGKITPKIANTAERLCLIYLGFTIAETIALLCCGLDFVDSLTIAFSTLGTGGFAQWNSSIASCNSLAIEIIITFFMFCAGVNFTLYFYVFTGKFSEIKKNSEFKAYLFIFISAVLVITFSLKPLYGTIGNALRYSAFNVATIMSTTGFANADFLTWPPLAQLIIYFLFFVGGSSGSTAGGFKVVRIVILCKQARNEMLRMLHPHGVFGIRLDGKASRKDVVFNVSAFVCVYAAVVVFTSIAGAISGLDVFTAFTASLSMIGNVGPAFGPLGPTGNYGFLNDGLKWLYSFVMIIGRLELYNLILLLNPDFWKK